MATRTNPYYVNESKPWFSKEAGWPDEVPKNVEFPNLSLGEMLRQSAQKWPDNRVMWFLDSTMTYRELDEAVDHFASGLAKLGVKKGDVVSMILPNSFQYVVAYYAAVRIGAIASGVNPTYKPMEVLHQLKTVGTKVLITLDALYESTVAPIIEQSPIQKLVVTNIVDMAKIPALKKWLGKLLKKIPTGVTPPDAIKFTSLLKTPIDLPDVKVDASDIATYIMTGGTTGVPKAAVLSHENCVCNAIQAKLWLFKVAEGACNVGVLPLFHSFAMTCVMNSSIIVGAWMMLFPRPPETSELLRRISELGVDGSTMYCGAEILFQRFAEFPGIEKMNIAGKLALCVSGAGPLHRPVQEAFESKTGARLAEGYGLTESSPVVSASPFWGNRVIGSIGLPFTGTDWRIVDVADAKIEKAPWPHMGKDPDSEEEKAKYVGEIIVAGPQVMVGYLNKQQETAETIVMMDGKRWLLTGDIGYMDTHGRIYIRDRKKQLIKYKGYSVFPKEVEELVGNHPMAREVAVAGLPDDETGERIKAWVVLKPEAKGKITEDELLAWCKENMTHYKVPSYIQFIEELPKTLVGKVLRRELQEADPIYIAYKEKRKGGKK
ncbi:MAG: long-chain fatty acid--CoA ligase [Myxococcales bacterium]|nr:MAG: long-chain fatty acid--CoA ligase [Myxococcales bacterium]